MKVLIVYAHPDNKRSFNASLLKVEIEQLKLQGHEVQVSDLYAENWKSQVDLEDFPAHPKEDRFKVAWTSGIAYASNTLAPSIAAEQKKVLWADFVIFQFPFWWCSMPAILKGWFDRIYSYGFAYDSKGRYGNGPFLGKKTMIVTTVGGSTTQYGPRGICGPIEDLLFPITHNILFFPGFDVLPSYVCYRTDFLDQDGFEKAAEELRNRLKNFESTKPIPFRVLSDKEYDVPKQTLLEGVEQPGQVGFKMHYDLTR